MCNILLRGPGICDKVCIKLGLKLAKNSMTHFMDGPISVLEFYPGKDVSTGSDSFMSDVGFDEKFYLLGLPIAWSLNFVSNYSLWLVFVSTSSCHFCIY